MKNNVRSLTEGAMVSAIYGLIILLDRVVANNIVTTIPFLIPIPLAVYGYRNGLKPSIITFVSMLGLTLILANPLVYIILFSALVSGIVVGYGFHLNKWDLRWLIVILFGVSLLENILVYFVFSALLQVDLFKETLDMVKVIEEWFHVVIDPALVKDAMYLSIIAVSLFSALLIIYSAHTVIRRLNKHVPKIEPIITIQMPRSMIYLMVGLLVLRFIPLSSSVLNDIFHFLSITAMFFLTLQGYFSALTLSALTRNRILGITVWFGVFISVFVSLKLFVFVCFILMMVACIDCLFPIRKWLVAK